MTTQEIQGYINTAICSKFEGYSAASMEVMTSEGGDGRFLGKVFATFLGVMFTKPRTHPMRTLPQ